MATNTNPTTTTTTPAAATRGDEQLRRKIAAAIDMLDASATLPSAMQFWVQGSEVERTRGAALNALSSDEYLRNFAATADNRFDRLADIVEFARARLATHRGKMMLFKQGVSPTWEDRANVKGGRFHLSCFSDEQVRLGFTALVLLVCAPSRAFDALELPSGASICPFNAFAGFQCCLKPGQLSVELWTKNASSQDLVRSIRKVLKSLFKRNILFYVHKTSVSIQQKGIEAVGGMRKNTKARSGQQQHAATGANNAAGWQRNAGGRKGVQQQPTTTPSIKLSAKQLAVEEAERADAKAAAVAATTTTTQHAKPAAGEALETALVTSLLQNAWQQRGGESESTSSAPMQVVEQQN